MSKSVEDLADIMEIMLTETARKELPSNGYRGSLTKSFKGLTIGFLDEEEWRFPADDCRPVESATQQMVGCDAKLTCMS